MRLLVMLVSAFLLPTASAGGDTDIIIRIDGPVQEICVDGFGCVGKCVPSCASAEFSAEGIYVSITVLP